MAPSSSRIQSSNLASLTLPFKYRRKSWSVDNSDDLSSDITTAPPPLSSAASSSSCSSSPIASSAILSSSNPGSPSEYNFARMRDHDEEAWFDTRLSVSYIPFASRVPARTEKGKYYEEGYGGQRERMYATGYEYDTAILSDDDHDLDPHDPTNDESLCSSPTRRISFTTSAERDRPYVRPTPAGISPSPSTSPAPSSSFPVSRRAFSNRLRESESLPPSSPGFSTASPGLPPSSPPPSSPFAMSIASPMSSPMRSISPFIFKRSISPEKPRENRRETTPPPPKRRGRVSIESLLSPDPLPRVSVTKIEMENSEKKRISASPTPRASSVLVTPDTSSEQCTKRKVTPNLRQSPAPISAPLISDSTAPILSDLHDASCSPPLDTPDLTSASTSDSSADPDSPAVEISPPVPLASPATLSCEFAEASTVSPVSSNAVSGESRDGDVVVSDVAPVPEESVPHDEDMDIVVDDTPERPSLPMSRHDSPVPSSSSTLIHELSRPSTSKSTAFSISVPEEGDYFPRTPVKRRASTSSSFSTRHSSPALPSSPLSPVSSVFDDGDVEIEEEEVVSKKRKGKGKVVEDEERERKRVKGEKSVRRRKSSASVVEADESDVDASRKEKREVKRKKKRAVVFSDEEDQEEERKPLKKRGRKPKASTEENAVASTSALTDDPEPKLKRKPGRPRKNPPPSPDPSPSKFAHLKASGMSVLDLLPFELPLALDELQGMVIETLATSRASSLGPSVVWSSLVGTRPALKDLDVVRREVELKEEKGEGEEMEEKMGRKEWMMLIEAVFEEGKMRCGMFGKVESSFKDDNGRPLEAQWFYVPECDPDTDRATLIRSMMPRPGKRTVTKQYKQYYWRPLGKISRWDDEDAI